MDVVLTEEEKREREAERKRRERAKAKEMAAILDTFMRELARYEVPLVQLLLAEYALNPCDGRRVTAPTDWRALLGRVYILSLNS